MKKNYFKLIKKILFEALLFCFIFSSSALCLIGFSNTSYSSFSSFLVRQRKNNSLDYTYGTVASNNFENYTSFYWYADDMPGSNLKGAMHTVFRALNDDNDDIYTMSFNSQNVSTHLFLYTTWDFKKFHYSFDIISQQDQLGLKTGEIYVTDYFAKELFNIDDSNLEEALEKKINHSGEETTIKGIIKSDSLGLFGEVFGTNFIMGNYNYRPFKTIKLIYEFIMFGSEIDTFADVVCIESAIKSLNSAKPFLKSSYFDFDLTSGFVEGITQKIKENTIDKSVNTTYLKIIGIISLLLSTVLIIFYFFSNINFFKKIRDAYCYTKYNVARYFITLFAFVFTLLLLKIIGVKIINYSAYNAFDFKVVTILFVIWIIVTILLSFLTKRDKISIHKFDLENAYYTVNI